MEVNGRPNRPWKTSRTTTSHPHPLDKQREYSMHSIREAQFTIAEDEEDKEIENNENAEARSEFTEDSEDRAMSHMLAEVRSRATLARYDSDFLEDQDIESDMGGKSLRYSRMACSSMPILARRHDSVEMGSLNTNNTRFDLTRPKHGVCSTTLALPILDEQNELLSIATKSSDNLLGNNRGSKLSVNSIISNLSATLASFKNASMRSLRIAHFTMGLDEDGAAVTDGMDIQTSDYSLATSVFSSSTQRCTYQSVAELYDLVVERVCNSLAWYQTARWMKYEQTVEGANRRFGRAHVPLLAFEAVNMLKRCLANGVIILDEHSDDFESIMHQITKSMAKVYTLNTNQAQLVYACLTKARRPVDTGALVKLVRTPAKIDWNQKLFDKGEATRRKNLQQQRKSSVRSRSGDALRSASQSQIHIMNRATTERPSHATETISTGLSTLTVSHATQQLHQQHQQQVKQRAMFEPSEESMLVSQVYVAEVAALDRVMFAMVRLAAPTFVPELHQDLPVRFLFVVMGPKSQSWTQRYHEIGRCIGALMADPAFFFIANQAVNRMLILESINRFLSGSTVVPPCDLQADEDVFNRRMVIKHINAQTERNRQKEEHRSKSQDIRASNSSKCSRVQKPPGSAPPMNNKPRKNKGPNRSALNNYRHPLRRTGKLFGGLIADFKERAPHYLTDYTDAFRFQCLKTIVFLFFASVTPALTFGGLLGSYTHEQMGILETLIAQCVCGVIWGLFSAQPLLMQTATGPVLIFEASLYQFATDLNIPFLTVRVWASVWLLLLSLVTTAFEGAWLLKYVTRFTEDIFSMVISAIFIAESVKFMQHTLINHPVHNMEFYVRQAQQCVVHNDSDEHSLEFFTGDSDLEDKTTICDRLHQPDTALFSFILVFATFMFAMLFKKLRRSVFLSSKIREVISDFGVFFSIAIVSIIDYYFFNDVYKQHVDMPSFLEHTSGSTALFPQFWFSSGQQWGYLFALVPGALLFILLFVETEITQLLLNESGNCLRKGNGGHHWDIPLMGLLCVVCAVFKLPWMCVAAVQSLAHCSSLTVYNKRAPGERPQVHSVIEQRVTPIVVALLVGLCAFSGRYISHLPLAALFGVFLYFAAMNCKNVQMLYRILLMFIPPKYYPDKPYCHDVRSHRMHLYTILQVVGLIIVYASKHYKKSSMLFPFVLLTLTLIRHTLLPRLFTKQELEALDGHEDSELSDVEHELLTATSAGGTSCDLLNDL